MLTQPLIITGMHRSGTSLVTQWLYKCGLNVGEDLMVANSGNEQGYFEDNDFVGLHETLLALEDLPATGLTDRHLPPLSPERLLIISRLLNYKNDLNNQWGWKDPRTCLFLPVYRQLVPHARYIVVYRDYRVCVNSLIQRMLKDEKARYCNSGKRYATQKWKWYKRKRVLNSLLHRHTEQFLKVWIRYNEEILLHLQSLDTEQYRVLDYQSLLADDRQVFDHITRQWNFNLFYTPFSQIYSNTLMSRDASIDAYITDKQLFTVAEELAHTLKAYALYQL
jgi:hypothetical protein